jgi:transcription antitermination protein NusB
MLYQWDVARPPVEEIIASISELQTPGEATLRFASELVTATVDRVEEIDGLIIAASERWRLDRMSTVDRNILRLAICELMERTTPRSVVINEALEVAKRYSTPEATAFVNGVLDAVGTRLETAAET